MSITTHTPGPWSVCSNTPELILMPERDGSRIVAQALDPIPYIGFEEQKANARLISAAPEMLETLRLLMEEGPELDEMAWADACDKARAAIAKATGT